MALVPITINFPALAVLSSAVLVPVPGHGYVNAVTGSLQAISLGTLTVNVRDGAGNLVDALAWTAAGAIDHRMSTPYEIQDAGVIRFDLAGVGVGAAGCCAVVWFNMD